MIKIQDHLDRVDADTFLEGLAEKHWADLNQKLRGGGFRANSLVRKCEKYLALTTTRKYIEKYADNKVNVAKRHKRFFESLLAQKGQQLKQIIISKPNQLETIKSKIYNILKPEDLFYGPPNNLKQTAFGTLLTETIFDYTKFRGSDFCKELFTQLGFKSATCPYCNNEKLDIVNLERDSKKAKRLKAYYDLDHFYSKSQNPFFALSFFNLIPSCHNCNSGDKRDKQFSIRTHIHPYLESFEDFYQFKISLMTLLGNPVDKIFIDRKIIRPQDKTISDLNLDVRYQNNIESVKILADLFWKNKNKIGTEFENDFKELLMRNIPLTRNEILKFERAKLNRDVLLQLDIDGFLKIS
jgi:hypothetical protein